MKDDLHPYEDPNDQMSCQEHDRMMRECSEEIDDGRWDDFFDLVEAIENDQEYQAEWLDENAA